jgi:hypothetical protein
VYSYSIYDKTYVAHWIKKLNRTFGGLGEDGFNKPPDEQIPRVELRLETREV